MTWWRRHSDSEGLLDHVEDVVRAQKCATFLTWLDKAGTESVNLNFEIFWNRSSALGRALLEEANSGDRVLLCFTPGPAFYVAFWACLRSGVIAVPVYPPDPSKLAKAIAKLTLVQEACDARLCLSDDAVDLLRHTTGLFHTWPRSLKWWNVQKECLSSGTTTSMMMSGALESSSSQSEEDSVAFLQFTSGSTGDPKGVMVSFGNLWHNVNCILLPYDVEGVRRGGSGFTGRFTVVSWLPQYHDLGLVYAHVARLCHGDHAVYMSPMTFIAKPTSWLDAISKYKAQVLMAPDFGYRLVAKRALLSAKKKKDYWDLSSVLICTTGAERLREETYASLFDVLGPYGFNATITPAYGLAESVVDVVATVLNQKAAATSPLPRRDVAVGSPQDYLVTIKIVDPETRTLVPNGETGEIFVSSPSVCLGYWGRPELSEEIFRARLNPDDGLRYLRTGDLGYFDDEGRLYICARLKDMIIVDGKNYYADDCEIAVQESDPDAIRPGCVASFSHDDGFTEGLVIVFEIRSDHKGDEVAERIMDAVSKDVGLRPQRIVAIEEKTIPKTTSGKIRRRAVREALDAGELRVIYDSNDIVHRVTYDSIVSDILTTRDSDDGVDVVQIEVLDLVSAPVEVLVPTKTPPPQQQKTFISWIHSLFARETFFGGGSEEHIEEQPKMEVVQLGPGTWVTAIEASVPDDPNILDRVRFATEFGDDDRVGLRAREILATEVPVAQAVQLAFIETAVEASVMGMGKQLGDRSVSLAMLGLTSMEASQLVHDLSSSLHVDVDMELLLQPDTPTSSIAVEILHMAKGDGGDRFAPRDASFTDVDPEKPNQVPKWLFDGLQLAGTFLVVTLVALSILPAYHYGLFVQWHYKTVAGHRILVRRQNKPWSHLTLAGTNVYGLLIPIVIPIFMASLSVVSLGMKWLVVGKYRPSVVHRGTLEFLRWWLVDRIFDQWEFFCGSFVKDTIFINIFYRLAGAHVALDASIDAFLREFDLVTIERRASVDGAIFTRLFEPGGTLRFAPVTIEERATVRASAVVMPGTTLEPHADLDHLATTAVGMRLRRGRRYVGSPAQEADDIVLGQDENEDPSDENDLEKQTTNAEEGHSWLLYESMKLMSLIPILYGPFLTSASVLALCLQRMDWTEWDFRYRELVYWVMGYAWGITTTVLLTIAAKWLLLGRVRPGNKTTRRLRVWIVEYLWFRIVGNHGILLFEENGWIQNIIWRALGADVAMDAVMLTLGTASAAEMDLVQIKSGAFLSGCKIKCEGQSVSIGRNAQVGVRARVHGGAVVEDDAVVGHLTIADRVVSSGTALLGRSNSRSSVPHDHTGSMATTGLALVCRGLYTTTSRILLLIFLTASLAPAYDLAVLVLYGSPTFYKDDEYLTGLDGDQKRWTPPMDRNLAIVLVAGPISMVARLGFLLAVRLWQFVVVHDYRLKPTDPRLVAPSRYLAAFAEYQITLLVALGEFIMPLINGSISAVMVLRFFGATVHSSVYFNTNYLYECPLTTLEADCVIDRYNVSMAHVFTKGRMIFKRKIVKKAAILHPHGLTWAGDVVPEGIVLAPTAKLHSNFGDDDDDDDDNAIPYYDPGTWLYGSPARHIPSLHSSV